MTNQIPGSYSFTRKDYLMRNLENHKPQFDVSPKTWVLPNDAEKLKRYQSQTKQWMIYKPATTARGESI